MKGNTQLPQLPEPEVEGEGADVEVAGEGEGAEVEEPSEQVADSSPREAKENLFCVMTWALSDRSATPVDVWETG